MSTSEQELRGQIAGMREALTSARASARIGKIVGLLGVLVGLCVVGAYVYAFLKLGDKVIHSEEMPKIATKRLEQLRLEDTALKVAQDAYPVFLQEGRKLVEEMDLPGIAKREFEIAQTEIMPIARNELERVAPKLRQMLMEHKDETLDALQKRLETKLSNHMAQLVKQQERRLGHDLGLDEASLARLVTNLQDGCLLALQKVVESRMGGVKKELEVIVDDVAELPELPDSPRGAILDEMIRVLVALVKHNLPDHAVDLRSPAVGLSKGTASPEQLEAQWAAEAAAAKKRVEDELAKREANNE